MELYKVWSTYKISGIRNITLEYFGDFFFNENIYKKILVPINKVVVQLNNIR